MSLCRPLKRVLWTVNRGLWTVDCRPCDTFSDFFGVLSFSPFYDFINILIFTCLMLDMKSSLLSTMLAFGAPNCLSPWFKNFACLRLSSFHNVLEKHPIKIENSIHTHGIGSSHHVVYGIVLVSRKGLRVLYIEWGTELELGVKEQFYYSLYVAITASKTLLRNY